MAGDSAEEHPRQPNIAAALHDEDGESEETLLEHDEEEEEEEEEEEGYEAEYEEPVNRSMAEKVFRRLSTEPVPIRVHDVVVKGNSKTKDSVIDSQVAVLKSASSMQELLGAAKVVSGRLQQLGIFDAVNITLDSGPPELPGTANVVVEVVETKNPLTGDIGIFTKPEARSWSLQGSLKLKNLFGYGDLWDGSLAYGGSQSSEISCGVSLPPFERLITPVMARVSLLSQDWLKFSSYKERALSLSLGLLSTQNHDLSYNLAWRTLTDPSQMASMAVRNQLGHSLLSALRYTYKIDRRNSQLRPTSGYAFVSTSHIGGLTPDYRSLRFVRQEFDFRYALPLGFLGSALNFGVSAGLMFPWGSGYLNKSSYLPERFFMGGNGSPVCTLGGPRSLFGFKLRGLGPAASRRQAREIGDNGNRDSSSEVDHVGGDLAVTAFADLSFDLPLKVLRDAGIHGHVFACAGSLNKLTENAYKDLTFQKLQESFRSSAGVGLIVPTKFFRMEMNYCYILKQLEHDKAKSGLQFSFSSPQ